MSQPNLAAMRVVADRLDSLGLDYAFVGGSIVNLLLDHPAVAFLATKHVAFSDRGAADYRASHDLEDFITVIDGREDIVAEVNGAPAELRGYVIASLRALVATAAFDEALPGHLPPDSASQQRLTGLRHKIQTVAALRATPMS